MGLGMIDGAQFATQPFMAFGSQPPGAMGMGGGNGGFGFGMGYGYPASYYGMGGGSGVPGGMHAGASTGGAPGHGYDMDFTSDNEDRALEDVIAALSKTEGSQL